MADLVFRVADHPATQTTLFDRDELPGMAAPVYEPEMTLQERFLAFHRANPHVYDALRRLGLDLVRRGHARIGIGMLYEVLRWQSMIVTTGDPYRLNNDYRSRYARILARCEPELADAFETRELKA